jgi:serine/threonine protein kinase
MKNWNAVTYGSLNYTFGFACAGGTFILSALSPYGKLVDISKFFDLQSPSHRFELLLCIINLARVIRSISFRIPTGNIMLYRPIQKQNGTIIELRDSEIFKRIPVSSLEVEERFEFLRDLYSSMQHHDIPHVIRCMKIEISGKKRGAEKYIDMHFLPHGCEVLPSSLKSFITAIRCVLLALEGLHKIGYAHRDIRWPNILRVTDQNWILIDFENSIKGNIDLYQQDIRMVVNYLIDLILLTRASSI